MCVGFLIWALAMWHGDWVTLQKGLANGGFCLSLADLQDTASKSETTALGFAGLTFAVLPVVIFSKSTAELLSLLFIIASTYFAFAPANLVLGLEGAARVTTVVTLGVIAVLVFIVAHAFKRAVAADAQSDAPPQVDRGYENRFWHTLPLTLLASGVIVVVAVAAPLSTPSGAAAGDTVDTYLKSLRHDGDTTRCGGGLTEPKPGPTKG